MIGWLLLAAVAATATPPPASVDDAAPLPCAPGVLRPKNSAPPPRPPESPELQAEEKEVAALRDVARRYQQEVDQAVTDAYRREKEKVRKAYLGRIEGVEAVERDRRTEAIAEFRDFLARHPDSPGGAEVTFRLAELEFEDASDRYVVAERAWDRAMSKLPGIDVGSRPTEPTPDYRRAIAAYRALVDRFPEYVKKDGALYMIAFCEGEQGDAKAARDAYEELATSFPKSAWAAESWVRVGEYHFDRGELPQAIAAYRHATDDPHSAWFDKALYKLAWSLDRTADAKHPTAWADAAAAFARLVDEAPDSSLRPESLQYLAIIWSDHGGLPAVKAATTGRPWAPEVLEALARIWYEEKDWSDAAATYDLVLLARPDDDAAPLWLNRRANALESLGNGFDAAAAREKLHFTYGPGSDWASARAAAKPDVVAEAAALAEPALLAAATWHHQTAQTTGQDADYLKAAELYAEYLKRYPGRPDAYDLAFYRGECLYFAGRFSEAADAYSIVLEFTNDDRWHAEAAFSRFKARERLASAPVPAGDPPPADAATRAIPAADRALADAAEQFTCVAPTDWRVPEALFRAAQVYYGARRLSAARSRAEAVVASAPHEDVAAYAAALVVDAWRLEGNWQEVAASAARFAAIAPGHTPAIRDQVTADLQRIAVEAGFRVALGKEESGDPLGAAVDLLALAGKGPALADKALFAAGEAFEKAGRDAEAAAAFGRLVSEHGASTLAEPAAFRRAADLERILEVETAAKAYADYVKRFPFSKDSQAASWNSAVLREAAGRPDLAAAGFEAYAADYPDAADGIEARLRGASDWMAASKTDKAGRMWAALASGPGVNGPQQVEALAGLARVARARRGDVRRATDRAVSAQADLTRFHEGTPESAHAAGAAGLALAQDLASRAASGTVAARRRALLELQDECLAVASLGDPQSATQAMLLLGKSYEEAAKKDPSLTAKAIAAHKKNVEVADAAHIATDATWESREALSRLDPERWPAPHRDAIPGPPEDVWAIPSMIVPPGSLVASNADDAPPPGSEALAAAVRGWQAATGRDALVASEKAIGAAVSGLPSGADPKLLAIAWIDLGVAREAIGDLEGARAAWTAAIAAAPEGERAGDAVAGQVADLARTGKVTDAIAAAKERLSKHPSEAPVRVNLAAALRAKGDAGAALSMALEAVSSDPRLAVARRTAVACALSAHRGALALFAARQAALLDPDDPRAFVTLGSALRAAGGDRVFGRAAGRAALSDATRKFPDDPTVAHAAGAATLEDGDAATALPLLEAAASRTAGPEAWIALAAARRQTGNAAGAIAAATQALTLRAADPGALRNLGLAKLDAGDGAGAVQALEEARRAGDDAADLDRWIREAKTQNKGSAP